MKVFDDQRKKLEQELSELESKKRKLEHKPSITRAEVEALDIQIRNIKRKLGK